MSHSDDLAKYHFGGIWIVIGLIAVGLIIFIATDSPERQAKMQVNSFAEKHIGVELSASWDLEVEETGTGVEQELYNVTGTVTDRNNQIYQVRSVVEHQEDESRWRLIFLEVDGQELVSDFYYLD